MARGLRDRLLFLRAFATHPRRVGAVLPTSRRAVRDMLDMGDVRGARLVVELGAGTGVYTREILQRLGPEGRFIAFERDERLAGLLAEQYRDPRLRVICDSAENVRRHLEGDLSDLVVSGLPFTSLGAPVRQRILSEIVQILDPDGVVLVLQYSPAIQGQLRRVFPVVRRRISLLNVPPAFLFACSSAQRKRDEQVKG